MIRLLPLHASCVALALAAGCARPPAASATRTATADTVRVDGSPALVPLARALADAYRAAQPGAVVLVGAGLGSRERIDAVRAGRIGIALASQATAAELAAQSLAATEFAKSAVVFAVNAGLPASVSSIRSPQLCDVYLGRISSWAALGGPSVPIAARTRPPAEVDAAVVLAGVPCFRDANASTAAKSMGLPEEMAAELASVPGALGMTSMPFVEASAGRIRALALDGVLPSAERVRSGEYPLVRSSFLVTSAAPGPAVARFVAFVRGDAGARVIRASGAVPLP